MRFNQTALKESGSGTFELQRSSCAELNALGYLHGVQNFFADHANSSIHRLVARRDGTLARSSIPLKTGGEDLIGTSESHDFFDSAWLQSKNWPDFSCQNETLRVADLFCGCGGLSLGLWEACRALEIAPEFIFACDLDEHASNAYQNNFNPSSFLSSPLEAAVDGALGARITKVEKRLKQQIGKVDFVLAGPPCQGHSDLNNHTRRNDPKNQLILRVARFAEVFRPKYVLIENVQGIRHDKSGALDRTRNHLRSLGYQISEGLLHADAIGVAQSRRRFFMFASLVKVHNMDEVIGNFGTPTRPLSWAISDLLAKYNEDSIFDSSASHSAENCRRINFLFERNLFELPNEERPNCHKSGNHSYNSVYGRMRWDKPTPTITTGFGSMGQGRFVHPLQRRTLTPHEAARVQFFPDFFRFPDRGRRQFQFLIGNAVPSKLAYAITLHQLR